MDINDISTQTAMAGGGGGAGAGAGGGAEYTGPIHKNVRQKLAALKTDARFSRVDKGVLNKIVDAAIQAATRIGSQKKVNIAQRGGAAGVTLAAGAALGSIGLVFPPALFILGPTVLGAISYLVTNAADSNDLTVAKSKLYENVVAELLKMNILPTNEQIDLLNKRSRSGVRDVVPAAEPQVSVSASGQPQSSVRQVLPNAPTAGSGYARLGGGGAVGAGAGDEEAAGVGSLADQARERIKNKTAFPPTQAREY